MQLLRAPFPWIEHVLPKQRGAVRIDDLDVLSGTSFVAVIGVSGAPCRIATAAGPRCARA